MKTDVKIYPNPATTNVNIRYTLPFIAEVLIEFYSSHGVLMKAVFGAAQDGEQHLSVPVTGLPAGMYLVRFTSKGMIDTKKLIVQ